MAAPPNSRQQFEAYVSSMFAEGLLDDQFKQLLMLEEDGGGFLAEVIRMFCSESEKLIAQLAAMLSQPVVDYKRVDAVVHQLKGSSSSMGARNVRQACVNFKQFCEMHDQQGCLMSLNEIRNAFDHVCARFTTLLQFCS